MNRNPDALVLFHIYLSFRFSFHFSFSLFTSLFIRAFHFTFHFSVASRGLTLAQTLQRARSGTGCSPSRRPVRVRHRACAPHGPHPGAYEGSIGEERTQELAVMLDCYKPLIACPPAAAVEDRGYMASFVAA